MGAMAVEEGAAQGIKSIEVGARVLKSLEQGRGPMSLSEVARGCELHPAKTHRYLVSLVRSGLASQSVASGLYDLGPTARHLGVEALRRVDPVSAASAHAVALRDRTGHTVNVVVWSDAGPALVRWDTGTHDLPIAIRVGSTLPLLDSAVGYVLLAHLPSSLTAKVLKAQQRRGTTRTLAAEEVATLKARIREEGLARTADQMIMGLAAVAAPIFNAEGLIEAALGLILPTGMATNGGDRRLGELLRESAQRASAELGYMSDATT